MSGVCSFLPGYRFIFLEMPQLGIREEGRLPLYFALAPDVFHRPVQKDEELVSCLRVVNVHRVRGWGWCDALKHCAGVQRMGRKLGVSLRGTENGLVGKPLG